MNDFTRALSDREHYAAKTALVLRQRRDDQQTTLQVRRVIPSGRTEELQIEITIEKFGEKRTTQMHSSFILPPNLADMLATACVTLKAKAPA